MKTLLIVRHAKSSWSNTGLPDIDRPLNSRGTRDAPFMGNFLDKNGIAPDLIISSPANRAVSTARLLAAELHYPADTIVEIESLYEAGMRDYLDVIAGIDDTRSCVMIVGHNPTVTDIAEFLSETDIDNLPTCSVVIIEFNTESWKNAAAGGGRLVRYEYPRKYRTTPN